MPELMGPCVAFSHGRRRIKQIATKMLRTFCQQILRMPVKRWVFKSHGCAWLGAGNL